MLRGPMFMMFMSSVVMSMSTEGGMKYEKIKKSVNGNGLLKLTNGNYEKYVLNGNRPYHLFIFYTAMNPKYGCTHCT